MFYKVCKIEKINFYAMTGIFAPIDALIYFLKWKCQIC